PYGKRKAGGDAARYGTCRTRCRGDPAGRAAHGTGGRLIFALRLRKSAKIFLECPRRTPVRRGRPMKIKAIVHEVEEGGFWAEVPSIAGCAVEAETEEEAVKKLHVVIERCLTVEVV